MMLLGQIAAWSMFAFGALLFAFQLAAHEVWFWIGRRIRVSGRPPGVRFLPLRMAAVGAKPEAADFNMGFRSALIPAIQ